MSKGSGNTGVIILVACFFLFLFAGGITAGLYYGNVTCPQFGANCPAAPSSQTPAGTTPPPPDTNPPVTVTPVVSDVVPAAGAVQTAAVSAVVPGTVSPSTTAASPIPTAVNPTPVATTPPPSAVSTPNPYITIPSPPPPAPSVHGFVPIQTVSRSVVLSPNKSTAPTAGDAGLADGVPLGQWNVPNLTTSAYLRFNGTNVMKVRNIAYYNLYGYFIDSSGNQIATPYSGDTRFSMFEIGNFYP